MKALLLLLAVATAVSASPLQDSVNAMNYPLCEVMRPALSYPGVLVSSSDVQVECGPRGLVGGLTLGLVNFTIGSHLGTSRVTVHQYVVRLDETEERPATVITVVQGGGPLLPAGTPVFLSSAMSRDGTVFAVRLIPCATPEAYGLEGMEEVRMQRRYPGRR